MEDIKLLKDSSRSVPPDLDDKLKKSTSIWFDDNQELEVVVEVDSSWAKYFTRRRVIPNQDIVEEREDGSLLLKFHASSVEEAQVCLKPCIPHVKIISPDNLRQIFVDEYKQWIVWQEGRHIAL
ncbi:MAG: WYL domain-containing protein [Deltaproteobacteria bacterium]|nr:WYL domain-containing protein [Deltaproteobacteria bacterium]